MNCKLKASIGVFWINTVCTLRCERCITMTPYHKKPQNFTFESVSNDIDRFFEIYDWIDHFDIEGGESLLHPQLDLIIDKAFEYKDHFNRLHILTNGTILPTEKLLNSCNEREILFIIDDYGDLSVNKSELIELLEHHGIEYRVDKYHGSDQYYDGWVSFGDMKNKHYSNMELLQVYSNCRQAQIKAPYIKNGKIFTCSIQASGIEYIPLIQGEYVDLRDDNSSIDERIAIAGEFNKKPLKSCEFCKGFDAANGERFPAAEQLPKVIEEELKICL